MDKNAIKKYAVWARQELRSRVKQRALQYGVSEDESVDANAESVHGHLLSDAEKRQRKALIARVAKMGYEQTMEEAAYTWFNRFIALRFMEVNGYLPTHIRVFTDVENSFKPQVLTEAIHLDPETMPGLDMEMVYAYKDKNQTDELFKYLIVTQCNALAGILPGMFTRIDDYTELLFPDNLLREGSAVEQMIALIPEDDWKDAVQIIGWLYQYYNTEPKQAVFDGLKKNVKITKETIPAATQLFTPDWIVRYMVENSLGRIFIDKRKNEGVYGDGRGLDEMTWEESEAGRIATEKEIAAEMDWKYYLPEAEQTQDVRKQLDEIQQECNKTDVKDIKCIDPCMGSGHILAYMFDVLMQIYESCGYTTRDAVKSIVENNLYGLDIDDRAAQLAYFAVMMKARQYDRRFFTRGIQPHVYAICESNDINRDHLKYMGDNIQDKAEWQRDYDELCYIVDFFRDAKEYGSILNPERHVDYRRLYEFRGNYLSSSINFETMGMGETADALFGLIEQYAVFAQKYDVVVTNPPYMGSSGMGAKLGEYVKKNYPDSKSDLFAVFMERCGHMTKQNCYTAMITQHSWMFLSSFEKLRAKLLLTDTVNMAHLGARAFEEIGGEVVQTTSWVQRKSHVADYKGTYARLVDYGSQQGKENAFLAHSDLHTAQQENFSKIPGSPIAYWVSDKITNLFAHDASDNHIFLREGLHTGDNDRFLREWFEVSYKRVVFDAHNYDEIDSLGSWVPYSKGGAYRKWYGNNELVVRFDSKGRSEMAALKFHVRPSQTLYFKEGATWSALSSGHFGLRYQPPGHMFDSKGQVAIGDDWLFVMTLFNTNTYQYLADILMPTLDYKCGDVKKLPYCPVKNKQFLELAKVNVSISKADWDSFETSWDFKLHPLVELKQGAGYGTDMSKWNYTVESAYEAWESICSDRFNQLKANEEELNRIFIDIYGLQDELTPEVEDKDVTVRRANLAREIRSLISYAVGCMFGRYSLDVDGLAYAGGEWDKVNSSEGGREGALGYESKYKTFPADKDNIIPICDDEYFDDDIVARFVRFVEVVYSKETLDENLRFIADALGGSGQPRDVIRNYFLNDFYADHLKIYQKRPIYWLFDSGKKNGFKALIYMHRYQPDTIARIRTDYVFEQQARYRTAIADLEQRIAAASTSERVKLTKQLQKLQAQDTEIRAYEEKIHHLADQMIPIDLDDGVKHNYELFKDVLAKIK